MPYRFVDITDPEERELFCTMRGFELDPGTVARQRPDRMCLLVETGGTVLGRSSLWWTETPAYEGHRLGYIGHYATQVPEAAPLLLRSACEELAKHGCTLAVGPIDGNTWQRYRFITERGNEPLFFMEPDNPDEFPQEFTDFGFRPMADYYSALNTDLSAPGPQITATAQRIHDHGITVHALDPTRLDEELRRVHALSLLSFRNNLLYTPISEDDFLAQYAPIRSYIRPDLVLLAEKESELIGYSFCIPDLLQAKRGAPIDTVILKTLAVHPDHSGIGLGGLLMALAHEAARQAGFSRVIHALFHVSNRSGRLSSHTARVFRRYTLFARPLKDNA